MTLRGAQLIEKLFFGRYPIAYLMRGTMKSYGPARWLDNYDTQANICTRYTWCCVSNLKCRLSIALGCRDSLSSRRQAQGGLWRAVCGGRGMMAEIMTSVDIIVWTLSLACPPQQDLTMSHGHGVDNCSLRFCRKGRQLNFGESRSPTQIFQRNL
jgi:hypothetical protein